MQYLNFFNANTLDCVSKIQEISQSTKERIVFDVLNDFSESVIEALGDGFTFVALHHSVDATNRHNVALVTELSDSDVFVITQSDPEQVSQTLLNQLNRQNIQILAPITAHYFKNRALFLISIPKGGTHLLYRLAEALGFQPAIEHQGDVNLGCWYCVEYSNSHTVARDFFIDSVRRAPFGNRQHPFARTPALFIYRNPLDIVVSEANYYHREGATTFSSYLRHMTFDDRLMRLIDDPYLLGSIRDRIVNFIPWFDCENVIPISFEELVGEKGGGDNKLRDQLIWSLQLKLHIPGSPTELARTIFDESSPTFHEGRIGASKDKMSEAAIEKFFNLNQDFMQICGYANEPLDGKLGKKVFEKINRFPSRVSEFMCRPLKLSTEDFSFTPIAIETSFLGHNLVRFNHQYFALPQSAGAIDLMDLYNNQQLGTLVAASNLNDLKAKIIQSSLAYVQVSETYIPERKTNWFIRFLENLFRS